MQNSDFPNLPRSWQVKTLGECLDYEQPTKYIVKSTKYNDSYKIPVLTAGKSFILGYTNESDGIFTQTPVIIFDDFTTDTKFVDFHFKVKSSAMKILHPKENIDIKFVYYLMQTIQYRSDTHKRYWISQYAKIKIPIPPLEIQKRIVKRLDKAFARIESGTKHLQSAKDNLAKYKQSLLKSAFNGTLTQDCPLSQCESATPSLHSKSIAQSSLRASNATEAIHKKDTHIATPSLRGGGEATTKQSIILNKHKIDCHESLCDSRNDENSPSLAEGVRGWVNPLNDNALDCHADKSARNDDKDSLNGESANIPQGWTIKTLGEVCEFAYGKGLKSAKRKTNGKYPVYAANGIKDYSDEYMIKEPSIIVGRKGSVGSLVLTNTPCWVLDVSYYVVFDKQKYDLMFLYHLLKTLNLNQYARGVKPGLSRSQAYELKVKIPPLEIQRQIVAVLEKHFTSADKVGVYINSCLTKAKQLKSSLLKSAFEGKL